MTALIISLLKFAGGPALVLVLRKLAPVWVKKLPASAQPLFAAAVNVLVAISTGADPVASIAMLVEACKAFVAGMGVIKTGDVFTGNASTVTAAEKAVVRDFHSN